MEKFRSLLLFFVACFLVYGFFFPQLPAVNADELWETSRAYHLKTQHKPGEPIIPKEVSPFYASVENMSWQGWFLGTVKTGSFALMMSVLPVNDWLAMRLTMFLWSLLACWLTYRLAQRFGLSPTYSLLAVVMLMFIPEFFSQIHRERAEILITTCLLIAVNWMMKAGESDDVSIKRRYYFLAGLFSWLPSFLVHPSAIIIPAVTGLLYLVFEFRNFKSFNTVLIGVGLVAGAMFFLYLMNSMREFAVSAGGGNYFNYQGPPLLVKGWKYVVAIPAAFYFKFSVVSPLSRIISFSIFLLAFASLAFAPKKFPDLFSGRKRTVLIVTIASALLILYLLSGSFGNYNVIVAPFVMIILSGVISRLPSKVATASALFLILIPVISIGMTLPRHQANANAFDKVLYQVDSVVPDNETGVMGLAQYYLPFRDKRFYSNSWFNQYAGIPGQSFEEAVEKLKVNYIIVDEAFIGRAVLDRGTGWTDSLIAYLQSKCEPVLETQTRLYAGNRVPEKERYPVQWQHPQFEKQFIRRVVVYHRKEAE